MPKEGIIPQQIVRVSADMAFRPDFENLSVARNIILQWLETKMQVAIPQRGLDGKSFTVRNTRLDYSAEVVAGLNIWAMRFEHPDNMGRKWRTEAVLLDDEKKRQFDAKLVCVRDINSELPPLSIPRFIGSIIDKVGLIDGGLPFARNHYIAANADDAKKLHEFLLNPQRRMPVVVLSELGSDAQNPKLAFDAGAAAQKLHGAAHVFVLLSDAS